MIAMARKYAPHAQVGLHASGWAASTDVMANADPTLDVAAEAAKVAGFLVAAGAAGGDFIAADMSDRDAGWYQAHGRNSWLDDTNQKLPTFHQAFAWGKAVAETAGKPMIWWQVPVGNMAMGNAGQQWKDNRVDYLFAHMNEVAAAHGAGVFFGAGDGAQTTPETDGGHLVAKAAAYAAGGSKPASPSPRANGSVSKTGGVMPRGHDDGRRPCAGQGSLSGAHGSAPEPGQRPSPPA